jgi:ABC-type branched-subunit amino acid transport system substrate-binding protein
MRVRLLAVVLGVAVLIPISFGIDAQPDEKMGVTRDIAARVGQILGGASACKDIAAARIRTMSDKLQSVFNFATGNAADLKALKQLYEKNAIEGQRAVTARQKECAAIEHDLAELEGAIKSPAVPSSGVTAVSGPAPAAAPPPGPARTVGASPGAPATATPPWPSTANPDTGRLRAAATTQAAVPAPALAPLVPANVNAPVRGVTADEIRFGMAAPFSGATKELGLQMKMGIEIAFAEANARGGVNGRMLTLVSADDGYEPARTMDAMKTLYDTEQVFGVIGNVGTPTATVSLPFALEHKMLFYGAFTGANLLRHNPPDRYVFNYRASYAEETDAVVRYLVRVRKLRPEQIAVFAQQDAYGDAGFTGVVKAMRALRGGDEGAVLRLNYKRNTIDVDEAVAGLRQRKGAIKAVVMVATYRAAAKFIEKTRDVYPSLIYTNVSFVGSSSLAEELMLLGPRYANGVIVTQVVPPVDGYASVVLDYKNALTTYSAPGEVPGYVSFEGYLAAKVLVEALRRAVPQFDTETVVDALETLRDYDIGLGVPVNFSRTEHQALHKVWGTQLDANGKFQPIELQ